MNIIDEEYVSFVKATYDKTHLEFGPRTNNTKSIVFLDFIQKNGDLKGGVVQKNIRGWNHERSDSPETEDWHNQVCYEACRQNNIAVLKWARSQVVPFKWNEECYASAFQHYGILMIHWMEEQNPPCPVPKDTDMFLDLESGWMSSWSELKLKKSRSKK
jgi:hypothetical protein